MRAGIPEFTKNTIPIATTVCVNLHITILNHCEVEGPNYIHPLKRYSLLTLTFFRRTTVFLTVVITNLNR